MVGNLHQCLTLSHVEALGPAEEIHTQAHKHEFKSSWASFFHLSRVLRLWTRRHVGFHLTVLSCCGREHVVHVFFHFISLLKLWWSHKSDGTFSVPQLNNKTCMWLISFLHRATHKAYVLINCDLYFCLPFSYGKVIHKYAARHMIYWLCLSDQRTFQKCSLIWLIPRKFGSAGNQK